MPGGTLVTRLKVYDTVAPDGQRGGTPHVHFVCSEMYFVLSGSGAVELIDAQGFAKVELEPHTALIFSPGTIHRLLNPSGDLELLITMQNSGLPERGDNVVCFEHAILESDEAYTRAMTVSSFEDAYRRRDRGVTGFLELAAAFAQSREAGRRALDGFYRTANERTKKLQEGWGDIVRNGALAEAELSLAHLGALRAGDVRYLSGAKHFSISAGAYQTPGFCGTLNRYFDPATLELDGSVQGNG